MEKCIFCNNGEGIIASVDGFICMECYHLSSNAQKNDKINKPSHYTKGGIEPIDFIISNKLDFCEGNAIKYITRYKHKNGLEDLKKAEFYIKKLISNYKKDESK